MHTQRARRVHQCMHVCAHVAPLAVSESGGRRRSLEYPSSTYTCLEWEEARYVAGDRKREGGRQRERESRTREREEWSSTQSRAGGKAGRGPFTSRFHGRIIHEIRFLSIFSPVALPAVTMVFRAPVLDSFVSSFLPLDRQAAGRREKDTRGHEEKSRDTLAASHRPVE